MISNPPLPLRRSRLLDVAERIGNALPDPALLFVFAMLLLAVASAYAAAAGWSAVNPVTGEALQARSLLTEASVAQLLGELPRTYAGFAPLGVVLTVVLGAGVADGSGLFAALLRASLRRRRLSAVPRPSPMAVPLPSMSSSESDETMQEEGGQGQADPKKV